LYSRIHQYSQEFINIHYSLHLTYKRDNEENPTINKIKTRIPPIHDTQKRNHIFGFIL